MSASEQPVVDTARVLDKQWEEVQRKTFTKWVNSKIKPRGIAEISDLATEFSDGVRLVQLLEIIGDETIKFNKNPKLRIQKVENVNRALDFIKSRGVNLFNIGGEDIVDSNQKLVLGMIWTIILRFTIADISEGELSAKEGLLLWCQRKTKGYKDVNVKDFTFSWQDGLAFCALIHRHRPDLLDFDALDKSNKHHNLNLAFEVAEKHLGIAKLLDVEDVADLPKPDERSIMTYVAQYFHAFSNSDKLETAGRRVGKFAAAARSAWEMQNEYERRTRELLARIDAVVNEWAASSFDGTYVDAIRQNQEFATYKQTTKRESIREKRDLETLLSNISTKLKTYKMAPYFPPAGLSPADVEAVWAGLTEAELSRRRSINETIRSIKESLRVEFAELANNFAAQLAQVSHGLAAVDGELDVQLQTVQGLAADLENISGSLPAVEDAYQRLIDANIEENDHTSYTPDDLAFDLETVKSSLRKKTAFIENQRVSQGISNVTPAQLEEFESTFRFFDKDQSNSLSRLEFKAGLAGLGFGYDDNEFDGIFARVSGGSEHVSFEQFVEYMVSITEDRQSADQIKEAFAILSQNKGFITESDLRIGQLPQEDVAYLTEVMPQTDNGYDYSNYVSAAFGN